MCIKRSKKTSAIAGPKFPLKTSLKQENNFESCGVANHCKIFKQ